MTNKSSSRMNTGLLMLSLQGNSDEFDWVTIRTENSIETIAALTGTHVRGKSNIAPNKRKTGSLSVAIRQALLVQLAINSCQPPSTNKVTAETIIVMIRPAFMASRQCNFIKYASSKLDEIRSRVKLILFLMACWFDVN